MSTLQEFLIKNAGMEKAAMTAIAKRLLASTMTPQDVFKRFGKVKGKRYLDDITAAIKNNVNSPSVDRYASNTAETRNYLRRVFDHNMSQQLHFNNKLSKADFLKPVENTLEQRGIDWYQSLLSRAGFMSGLSDLYNTLPRQDKLIVSKYLRGAVPESGLQHLSKDVQQAAQKARAHLVQRAEAPVLPEKSQYAQTLQQQYGIKSREELIKGMQDSGIDFNPVELQHSHYVTGPHNPGLDSYDPKHKLLAATKLPFTTPDRLPAQITALNDVLHTSGQFNSTYLGAKMSELPRSVQKALQIIKGENLLQPGTRANRLFSKVYNNKSLNTKLKLTDKFRRFAAGESAAYDPDIDAILVHPKVIGAKNTAGIEAHERGHRAALTMAPDAHADEAFRTFRKMQLLGKKHNMTVPLTNWRLMQEAFAESYIPKLLGPNSGAAEFFSPRQQIRAATTRGGLQLPELVRKNVRRTILRHYKANRDAINAMRASEDTKDLFRQLAFNYGYPLVR